MRAKDDHPKTSSHPRLVAIPDSDPFGFGGQEIVGIAFKSLCLYTDVAKLESEFVDRGLERGFLFDAML